MKKIVFIIALIFLIGTGIFLFDMFQFAKGVQNDIELNKNNFDDETYNVHQDELDTEKGNDLLNKINENKEQSNTVNKIEPGNQIRTDTIIEVTNKLKLELNRTESVNIKEYYLDKRIIDSINIQEGNRHSEALGVEKYKLKTQKDIIKRDSTGFYVKLTNGIWKKLELNVEWDEVDHTFEHLFNKFGFYSIRVQWGEGNGYKLVNNKNGKVIRILGRPYFSPNGKYILSVNSDLEADYSENGFELFENNESVLKKVILFEPKNWGPFSAKWIDDDTVIMKNEGLEIKNDSLINSEFYIRMNIVNGG